MPSKSKAPALDRLVRREWMLLYPAPSRRFTPKSIDRQGVCGLIQRVAAECARIADESGRFRQDAVDAIRREFRIEEGQDG